MSNKRFGRNKHMLKYRNQNYKHSRGNPLKIKITVYGTMGMKVIRMQNKIL